MREKEDTDDDWLQLVESLEREGILRSPEVIRALRIVPRTKFLPDNMKKFASTDAPIPIGSNQTISAPHNRSNRLVR